MTQANARYVVVWDQLGLEAVWDLGAAEQQVTFDALRGEANTWNRLVGHQLQYFMMRARYNSHRHYEIYVLETDPDITADTIRDQFETDPQYMADLVRSRGVKVFSDREHTDNIKIR
jgi:hypothetical protein